MRGNYLNQINNSKDALNVQDYSLSNNNLTIEDLMGVIESTDIEKFCELMTMYPDYQYKKLKKVICRYYKIDSLVLGCGSEEIIVRLNGYFHGNKMRIGVLKPNFYRIKDTAKKCSSYQINYSSESPFFDLNCLKSLDFSKEVDVLWISNPNPIIGKISRAGYLEELIESNPNVLFVVDESAMDLVKASDQFSLLKFSKNIKNLIVVKSFSKLFSLAGLRAGFATGNMKILSEIEDTGPTFPVNNLADFVLCKMLKNRKFAEEIVSRIHSNKEEIENILVNNLNLSLSKSVTNCVFLENLSQRELNKFKSVGIIPLNLNDQEGILFPNMVRVTVHGSKKIFKQFLDKMEKIV